MLFRSGGPTDVDIAHIGCGESVEVTVACRGRHEVGLDEVELLSGLE